MNIDKFSIKQDRKYSKRRNSFISGSIGMKSFYKKYRINEYSGRDRNVSFSIFRESFCIEGFSGMYIGNYGKSQR